MKIVSLWSGPRNVSTALMYAFNQHPDVTVVDEPLYGHYLKITDAEHPGKEEVLATMNTDGNEVLTNLSQAAIDTSILFLKNMAHHFIELDYRWLDKMSNVFLVRDPVEMLPSLSIQIPNPILRDTGLDQQVRLLNYLEEQRIAPVVIQAKVLLQNPENCLARVCEKLDIPFYKEMLRWPEGPIKEDGIWARYWYHNVHKSTGFQPYQEKKAAFPDHLQPLLDECLPYYQKLITYSI